MEALINEVGLTDNLLAYWNVDTTLLNYPDSSSSSYKQYDTQGQWQGTEVAFYNSTIDTSTTPGNIIINAPSAGGNSGIVLNFTTPLPTGTTLLKIYAYGTTNVLSIDILTGTSTVTKTVGTFDGNGTKSWKLFTIEVGSFPIASLRIYINASDYTIGSYPSLFDSFIIDYVNLFTDTQYFNNTWSTADSWVNAIASNGALIQNNTVISRTFTPNLLNQRFRAQVKVVSGTNPIFTVNGINSVITTDGNYSVVDVILPSTTTVSITSTGNTVSYSFIYIGLGSYSTYQADSLNGNNNLYAIGTSTVNGVSGNALRFYNAYAYCPTTFSLSAPITFSFLMYIEKLPTAQTTVGAVLVSATNGYPSVGINYLGNIVFSFIDTFEITQNLIGTVPLTPKAWHYIVATHNGTTATIYNDGSPDPLFTATMSSTSNTLNIGAFDTVNTLPFNGSIEDIRVFSSSLASTDILTQYKYFSSIISGTATNYGTTVDTGLFASYRCNDVLPNPPDGNRVFYVDSFTTPYNLNNIVMLNTTIRTDNTTSTLFSSVNNPITGFTVDTSIATSNNYFRINVKNNDPSLINRNLYVEFYNSTTLLSTATLQVASYFTTLEYVHTFGSTVTNIRVFMNDAQPAYGFEVTWMYMSNGTNVTTLLDYSGYNNNASLINVFSDPVSGIDFTGNSSLTIPSITFTTNFAISFWAELVSLNETIFSKNNMNVNVDSSGVVNLVYNNGSGSQTISYSVPIAIDILYHFMIVYESHIFYIYINGEQLVSNADNFADTASNIIFGTTLSGILNKIRVYTRAPDRGEIKYLFTNNL